MWTKHFMSLLRDFVGSTTTHLPGSSSIERQCCCGLNSCFIYSTARLYHSTPLGPFPSVLELCTGQKAICTSSSLYIVIAHAPQKHPESFPSIPQISKFLRGGTTHYIVTSGRLCAVQLAVPPAAKPVNSICPSAEEVHASKGSFQKLIQSSPSGCGARTEIRYRDRIAEWCGRTEVERRLYFSP
jgi:hypothetical protein